MALAYLSAMLWLAVGCFLAILYFSRGLPTKIIFGHDCNSHSVAKCDAIRIAAQLGRLDFASTAITILGVVIALFAIFGFLYVRERSEHISKETAGEVAESVAKKVAAEYFKKRDLEESQRRTAGDAPATLDTTDVEREGPAE